MGVKETGFSNVDYAHSFVTAANSLWNSLLEPVGNKTPHAVELPFSRFLCPAEESPYIFTDRNSVT